MWIGLTIKFKHEEWIWVLLSNIGKRKANKNPMRDTPKNKILWENVKNINKWAKIYQAHISKKFLSKYYMTKLNSRQRVYVKEMFILHLKIMYVSHESTKE